MARHFHCCDSASSPNLASFFVTLSMIPVDTTLVPSRSNSLCLSEVTSSTLLLKLIVHFDATTWTWKPHSLAEHQLSKLSMRLDQVSERQEHLEATYDANGFPNSFREVFVYGESKISHRNRYDRRC